MPRLALSQHLAGEQVEGGEQGWLAVQGGWDQLGHTLVIDRPRFTLPQLVVQPIDTPLNETSPPLAVALVNPKRAAILLFGSPPALANTIRAQACNAA